MPRGPVRRSHLIAPFGVGSIVVMKGGTSLICAGLDHWYEKETTFSDRDPSLNVSEFKLEEPRLQSLLQMDHFRLPPDFRKPQDARSEDEKRNLCLTVPFLRFPAWHVCRYCGRLVRLRADEHQWELCPDCLAREPARKSFVLQVRFVAMCDHGHIQDFPWNEWVHHSDSPACSGEQLRLTRSLGTSLSAFIVRCDECETASRSLDRITTASKNDSTFLSENLLDNGRAYLCQGERPWLADRDPQGCGRPLRGALPGAANVYYPDVVSALYVPDDTGELAHVVDLLLHKPALKAIRDLSHLAGHDLSAAELIAAGGSCWRTTPRPW